MRYYVTSGAFEFRGVVDAKDLASHTKANTATVIAHLKTVGQCINMSAVVVLCSRSRQSATMSLIDRTRRCRSTDCPRADGGYAGNSYEKGGQLYGFGVVQ